MQLHPFVPQDEAAFLSMSHAMYDSPAVAHTVSEDVFRATFAACLAGGQNIEGWRLEENGVMAGYLLLAHTFSTELGGPILMVEELYLEPRYRGHGAGRAVLEELRRKYTGQFVALKLECTPQNEGAMHLYRSLGFEPLPYTAMVLPI